MCGLFFSVLLSTKNSIIKMAELKFKRITNELNKKCAEAEYLLHKILNLQKPNLPTYICASSITFKHSFHLEYLKC